MGRPGQSLEQGEEALSTLHPTPSLSSVREDLVTASLRGSLLLPLPPPKHRGPSTYLFSAVSPFSSKPSGFGDRTPWNSESAGTKATCRAKGRRLLCSCPHTPWAAAPPRARPNLPTCPGREAHQGGLPLFTGQGSAQGQHQWVDGTLGSCSHLALHSPNEHVLSTCCVPSTLVGPRGQQGVDGTNIPALELLTSCPLPGPHPVPRLCPALGP